MRAGGVGLVTVDRRAYKGLRSSTCPREVVRMERQLLMGLLSRSAHRSVSQGVVEGGTPRGNEHPSKPQGVWQAN